MHTIFSKNPTNCAKIALAVGLGTALPTAGHSVFAGRQQPVLGEPRGRPGRLQDHGATQATEQSAETYSTAGLAVPGGASAVSRRRTDDEVDQLEG